MKIEIHILDGPLPNAPASAESPDSGAVVEFRGIVRPIEDGRPLVALDYQIYDPMALDELGTLAKHVGLSHGLHAVRVWHSRGRVAVGECSFRLVMAAGHRKEALAAMDEFIDRMKRDVPIWKSPVWADTPAPTPRAR